MKKKRKKRKREKENKAIHRRAEFKKGATARVNLLLLGSLQN